MKFEDRYPLLRYDPTIEEEVMQWVVESVWMRGRVGAVLGPEKCGKSRLIGWLLAAL